MLIQSKIKLFCRDARSGFSQNKCSLFSLNVLEYRYFNLKTICKIIPMFIEITEFFFLQSLKSYRMIGKEKKNEFVILCQFSEFFFQSPDFVSMRREANYVGTYNRRTQRFIDTVALKF